MNFGPVLATRKGLTSVPQLDYTRFSDTVNLSHNPIKLLDSLPVLDDFKALIMDNTKLESFDGAKPQPNIETFSCINTPLGNSKFIALMSVIIFGEQLKIVNNVQITQKVLDEAKQYQSDLYNYLQNGWILTGLNPLKVANVQTHERIIINKEDDENGNKPQKEEIEIFMKEDTSNEDQKQQTMEVAQRKLRYRFNELVHPAKKPAPSPKPQKQETDETTPKSYRAQVRNSPARQRLSLQKKESPFPKKKNQITEKSDAK